MDLTLKSERSSPSEAGGHSAGGTGLKWAGGHCTRRALEVCGQKGQSRTQRPGKRSLVSANCEHKLVLSVSCDVSGACAGSGPQGESSNCPARFAQDRGPPAGLGIHHPAGCKLAAVLTRRKFKNNNSPGSHGSRVFPMLWAHALFPPDAIFPGFRHLSLKDPS